MKFTKDDVRHDFEDAIDTMVGNDLGRRGRIRRYVWDGPEESLALDDWPIVVVYDGRRFEVAIDVRVVELPGAAES